MPDLMRNRGRAGRLIAEGDPLHRRRPDQGSVRPERGVRGCAWQQATASLRLRNRIASSLLRDQPGPALPFPGRAKHIRVEPATHRPIA